MELMNQLRCDLSTAVYWSGFFKGFGWALFIFSCIGVYIYFRNTRLKEQLDSKDWEIKALESRLKKAKEMSEK